jgi:heptosyltransferase III
MRLAWPDARIDCLVFSGTGSILAGNPDCDEVIELALRPSLVEYARIVNRLFRRYDLAVTTQSGDRPYLLALLAARQRMGLVADQGRQSAWKRRLADTVLLDNWHTHTVVQNLKLTTLMGVDPCFDLVPPIEVDAASRLNACVDFDWRMDKFIILHPFPSLKYKCWTDYGWNGLIHALTVRGYRIVLSGGADQEEVRQCSSLAARWPHEVFSLAGQLSFGTLATLLLHARCFVGPDTATTHLAAACATPTVALFGPSNPVKWGPWPVHCTTSPSPWMMRAMPWQRVGNVLLLQGQGDCVPCFNEGCDRHRQSTSECLLNLSVETVLSAVDEMVSSEPLR